MESIEATPKESFSPIKRDERPSFKSQRSKSSFLRDSSQYEDREAEELSQNFSVQEEPERLGHLRYSYDGAKRQISPHDPAFSKRSSINSIKSEKPLGRAWINAMENDVIQNDETFGSNNFYYHFR